MRQSSIWLKRCKFCGKRIWNPFDYNLFTELYRPAHNDCAIKHINKYG